MTAMRVQITEDFPHTTTIEVKVRVNGAGEQYDPAAAGIVRCSGSSALQ
jgi:hypothetical protein